MQPIWHDKNALCLYIQFFLILIFIKRVRGVHNIHFQNHTWYLWITYSDIDIRVSCFALWSPFWFMRQDRKTRKNRRVYLFLYICMRACKEIYNVDNFHWKLRQNKKAITHELGILETIHFFNPPLLGQKICSIDLIWRELCCCKLGPWMFWSLSFHFEMRKPNWEISCFPAFFFCFCFDCWKWKTPKKNQNPFITWFSLNRAQMETRN